MSAINTTILDRPVLIERRDDQVVVTTYWEYEADVTKEFEQDGYKVVSQTVSRVAVAIVFELK